MDERPLVSVCMITYNHATFIAEAIEGVLMQKTDFPIELIIADDFSTDDTGKIAREYSIKYPDTIRILPRESNLGILPNFIDSLRNCSGEYIAICEGDDYWTDPLKLQKQVDFLEANPDFAISSHRVRVMENGSNSEEVFPDETVPKVTAFKELSYVNYIPTLSCVFRNKLFEQFPSRFEQLSVGDYPLHLLNAQHGLIRHFDDVMGTYRIHHGGAWSLIADEVRRTKWLEMLKVCDEYFYPLGHKGFQKQIDDAEIGLCFFSFKKEEFMQFRAKVLQLVRMGRIDSIRTLAALAIRFVVSFNRVLAQKYIKISKS